MSTRERWIVYPLLFLALATAMRPKFFPFFREMHCEELVIMRLDGGPKMRLRTDGLDWLDANDRPQMKLVSTPDGPSFTTFGKPETSPRVKRTPARDSQPEKDQQRQPPTGSQPKPNALSATR